MNNLNILRFSALAEGTSWLALLFIAMPLKYVWGDPSYVKIVGMTHGLLFIALLVYITLTLTEQQIDKREALKIFIASFIPFGTFFTDKSLRDVIEAHKAQAVLSINEE